MEIKIGKNEKVLISFDSDFDPEFDQGESEITDLISAIGRLKIENIRAESENCGLIREKTELTRKIKELQKEIEELRSMPTNFDPR